MQNKKSKIEGVRGIVFFTGHNPKLQRMALFVIPGDNGYISTNSGQNALKISGAVKNIVEHGTLKLKNNKFNGFEVMQVLAMSGMAFSD